MGFDFAQIKGHLDSNHTSSTTGVIAISASSPRRPHEQVVPPRRRHAGAGVAFEQGQVAQVRLPPDIDEIAQDRHQPDEHVDGRVQDHPRLDDDRQPHPDRLQEDQRGEHWRRHVADARDQADDGVEAEADAGARHAEPAVEQDRPATQRVERDRIGGKP